MQAGACFWDERYRSRDYAYGKVPNAFLSARAKDIPIGPVLCVGAGEGRNAVYLADLGYEVVAVDGSLEGSRKTQELAAEQGIVLKTITADLASFKIERGRWAGIVSIFCHVPPTVRTRLHQSIVDGLAPGGVFVLEAYTPGQLELRTGGPPALEMLYSLDVLTVEIADLALEHGVELERDVTEGRFHSGRGAVVQIVARQQRAAKLNPEP